MRLSLSALVSVAAAGCSLVKLSDDIEIGKCARHSDCEVLNDRSDPDFDPCFLWQCNVDAARCEMSPLDADGDGYTPATAEHDGEQVSCSPEGKPDCDDGDDDANPGLSEACDGSDNDCDGRIDEGRLRAQSRSVIDFPGDSEPLSISYADNPGGGVVVAYSLRKPPDTPGIIVVPASLEEQQASDEDELSSSTSTDFVGTEIGVAAMEDLRVALALVNLSGSARTVVGLSSAEDASDVSLDPVVAKYGLACLAEEACAENASMPDQVIEAPDTIGPAVATLNSDVLVAYLRASQTPPDCEAAVDATDKPRVLVSLTRRRGATLSEVDAEPTELGVTPDYRPPALVGVPPLETSDTSTEVGFLLARVREDGTVVLERLWDEDGLKHETLLGLGNAPASELSIALGPEAEGSRDVAVAHTRGCRRDGRVVVHLIRLSVDGDGGVQAERMGNAVVVDQASSQRTPSIAYAASQDLWAVAFHNPVGLRARLLEPDGTPRQTEDGEAYVLLESTDDRRLPLHPFMTAATQGDAWLTALTPVFEAGEPRVEAIELVCR